jgi:hypothetical protein
MATREERLGADKAADCLVVLFIPSVDRDEKPIDQEAWVTAGLKMLGALLTGGTAFPQGRGVWRDDSRGGLLIFDEPTLIQCYTTQALVDQHLDAVRDFLLKMGGETNQGAVGIVIDGVYYEIKIGGKVT